MKRLALILILLAAPAVAKDAPVSRPLQIAYDVTAILDGMAKTPAGLAEVRAILQPKNHAVVILH